MVAPIPLPNVPVLDVAIVGAGLCGLALARTLNTRGLNIQLFEARERLGGRILSAHCDTSQQMLDLGPTWFWSETEPRISALLGELGIPSQAQYDPGDALWLTDPNRQPERRSEPGGVHVGARCITGGAARLIQALAATLPPNGIHLGRAVTGLRDQGAYMELQTSNGSPIRARQVVLALPPRLIHEHLQFTPPLPSAVWEALTNAPTWMAAQAKSVTTFKQAFWRAAGHSGNAFVRHAQAVLAEVFDCSDSGSATHGGALGGFVALNAAQRESFQRGLPLLIDSQLAQLFGPQAQDGQLFLQDWARERWTCSTRDRASPPEAPFSDPLLRQPLWQGRLFLGGSETAAHGVGHMEGALESADRIAHAICRTHARGHSALAHTPPPTAPEEAQVTRSTALGMFAASVLELRGMAPERYRLHLIRLLSSQQSEWLTQRALLAVADQVYSESLARLDHLLPALDTPNAAVTHGRHALTTTLLAAFEGWNKGLLDAALSFNATSCALSNFPLEHQPDADTLHAITLDLAAAWREFALELNTRLLVAASET
ncbi:hypothetical protein MIZ03_0808 [Rhodoferax lithotrophicus]|uniref:Amine oxidase domain-containing protein n=1 Tax=Rhodoferax lithotrophicus TaxID=2798804 RepID=A0ABN6D209_9BURK|nr:FAD-dependent oxidoreductase [Rhodoferax sp. MIZ03]BCO25929.1 hypothetical protein MIZ03_0808 [Rhodoferax sp. MIZ03]